MNIEPKKVWVVGHKTGTDSICAANFLMHI